MVCIRSELELVEIAEGLAKVCETEHIHRRLQQCGIARGDLLRRDDVVEIGLEAADYVQVGFHVDATA